MEQWKKIDIANVCTSICSGGTPKSTRTEYYGGDIPWLNTKEVNFNRINSTDKKITLDGLESSSAKWIDANSVVVAMYGATAGKVAITKIPLTTNQACCNLTINPQKADYRFVYYALYNDYIRLASLANGGAQQNLNAQRIKDFDIPYPCLSEQKKIADLLSSLDDKIELNRRINDNLEQQARALFKSWFVDFEPFKDGKFIDSELGLIPEGWRVETLGDYCKVKSGFAFKSAWWQENGIKVIKIKNIGINNTLDTNDCSYVSEDKMMFAKDFYLQEYDLLIAMTGATIGKFTIVPDVGERLLVNQRVGKFFLGKNPVNKLPFLYLTLKQDNVISDIINRGQGSAQPNISPFDIETVEIAIPNSDILDNFNCKMQPIFKSLTHFTSENQNLERLRDALLPKLMSGELKINDLNS